ncbi:hypothetical protein HanPSC8_Chr06g0252471 [Helianthus annuus]|nr:hypothetical protein HanPSC8_Chr06g0252471 [Helianthus annuus]
MAPIKRRGQLSHDLHLSADDRGDNKADNNDTWLQSRCASTDEHLEATKQSRPARQRAYSLLSVSGPRPISPQPLTPLRL